MSEQPRRQRTPARAAAQENGAYMPPVWELADVSALQALQRGNANPDQQKRALDWILMRASGAYEMSFRPGGEDGRRETDFAEGRRFVGLQIVKVLRLNLAALPRKEPRADKHDETAGQ